MKKNFIKPAFTLAEMMVVMLILSIVMAAFAPVMTTRGKTDLSSPWRPSSNGSDIYYGLGLTQTAMIGQRNKPDDGSDPDNRLTINTANGTQSHILFKQGPRAVLGRMFLNSTSVMIGDTSIRGNNNAALGIGALRANTTGSENIGIGLDALRSNTTGSSNTAIGDSALLRTTTGTNNSAIGTGLISNTTGSKNTALGDDSLAGNTTGSENTAVGVDALGTSTTSGNTAVGYQAGTGLINQNSFTTAIGYQSKSTGSNSTSIGSFSKATGYESLSINSNASGASSTSIGYGVASNDFSILLAPGPSQVGAESKSESSGYTSIAIGGNSHSTGSSSIAIGTGSNSLADNTIAIGVGSKSSQQNNILVGPYTKAYRSGAVVIGKDAQVGKSGSLWGDNSVAIGQGAASGSDHSVSIGYNSGNPNQSSGSNNTAIGSGACKNVTGSNKICIGQNSGPGSDNSLAGGSTEAVWIGSKSKYNGGAAVLEVVNDGGTEDRFTKTHVAINGNLLVRGLIFSSNSRNGGWFEYQSRGDDNGHTGHVIHFVDQDYGMFSDHETRKKSDVRLKYVGKENLSGLDKIKQIKVFNYTFKKDDKKTPRVGVMAQDLQKIFPDAVTKDEKGFLQIRMEDMFYAVINAVKELDNKITNLTNQMKILQEQNKHIIQQNKQIEARLKSLEASKK